MVTRIHGHTGVDLVIIPMVRFRVENDVLVEKRDATAGSVEGRGRVRRGGGFLYRLPDEIRVDVRGNRSTEKDTKVDHIAVDEEGMVISRSRDGHTMTRA